MQLTHALRAPRHEAGGNGGFPEPPHGVPTRIVRRAHPGCGAETRIRLPQELPDEAVRHVRCDRCRQTFEAPPPDPVTGAAAATAAAAGPVPSRLALASEAARDACEAACDRVLDGIDALRELPRHRLWALASVPLAALGVLAGLMLIQGSDDPAPPAAPAAASATSPTDAKFIQKAGYSLALPAGWQRTDPPGGASFRAEAAGGDADATLWIERAPGLSFKQFQRRSLGQLAGLAANARVVDRVDGPTLETSIVELRADAPVGDGGATAAYRVTLRAAGDYRLYFATVAQPSASPETLADIGLLHGSLRPEVELEGAS